ncbi:MAG TPA: hypothetical protein VHB46_16120 [Burkholderiales bacterium]|nr:hypothetical protein [Burkholderiales bacterium]
MQHRNNASETYNDLTIAKWLGRSAAVLSLLLPVAPAFAAAEYLPICNLPKCLNPQVTAKTGVGTANATAEAKTNLDDATKWCATYKPRDKYCPKEQVQSGWIGFRNTFRATADCTTGKLVAIDGNTYSYAGTWADGAGKGRPKFTTKNVSFPVGKWEDPGVSVDNSGTFLGWGGGASNLATQWEVLCAGAPAPATK